MSFTQLSPSSTPPLMMTSKRKRGSGSVITIDSDSDPMDDLPGPRNIKTSSRARQPSDPDKVRAMRNGLGMLQLDSTAEGYRPLASLGIASSSAHNQLYNFSPGDFVADDEFDEDAIDIARLFRSARLSKARRDLRNKKTHRTIDIDMEDSSSSSSDPETVENTLQEPDRDDYMTDGELKRYLAQVRLNQTPIASPSRPASPQRQEINSFAFKGSNFRPEKTVELLNGDFLRVKRISQETDGRILLFR
jgi:hypothetical protein